MAIQAYSDLCDILMTSSDAAASLDLDDVQAALLLCRPRPAARALILACTNLLRAGPAADAWISLVVEDIVRNVVPGNEAPNVLLRPAQQRIHFDEIEFSVPGYHGCLTAVRRLIAA